MKEYIVTGATGYIGFVLVNQLLKEGYSPIKILIRSKKSLARFDGLAINWAIGDINDEEFLTKEISPNAVVFHLAGIIDIGPFKRKQIYETNVLGSKKIVNACIKNKAQLIYTSSVSAILPGKKGSKIVEPLAFNHKRVVGHYAKTKAITTEYILEKARQGRLNAVVVYPSAVIGPYDYNISNLGQVVIDYINQKLPAYTKGKYNFVDVRDVVDGIIKAYELGISGEDYLLTGQTVDLKDMFLLLNKILNRPKLPIKLPLWLIKLTAPFAELHYIIRGKKPVISRTSIKILNQNANFDNSKAVKQLGYNPTPLYDSFNDMINWFYENKHDLIKINKPLK